MYIYTYIYMYVYIYTYIYLFIYIMALFTLLLDRTLMCGTVLQHSASHSNVLQHTTPHCNTPQHKHLNTLHPHCNPPYIYIHIHLYRYIYIYIHMYMSTRCTPTVTHYNLWTHLHIGVAQTYAETVCAGISYFGVTVPLSDFVFFAFISSQTSPTLHNPHCMSFVCSLSLSPSLSAVLAYSLPLSPGAPFHVCVDTYIFEDKENWTQAKKGERVSLPSSLAFNSLYLFSKRSKWSPRVKR